MFVLLYKPPCGEWYVHSHKIYGNMEAARSKARKFLPRGTPIAILALEFDLSEVSKHVEFVE